MKSKWGSVTVIILFLAIIAATSVFNTDRFEEINIDMTEKNLSDSTMPEADNRVGTETVPGETEGHIQSADVTVETGSIPDDSELVHIENSESLNLRAFYSNPYSLNDIEYMLSQPYSFLIFIDFGKGYEGYVCRNVDRYNPVNEVENLRTATHTYAADQVVDRYIREYGGEDTEYFVRWLDDAKPDGTYAIETYEIYNDDTRLIMSYKSFSSIVCILIEDETKAEVKTNVSRYEMRINYETESLLVRYRDNSWLVEVEIV